MDNSCIRVLDALQSKQEQGVTAESFDIGFRLAARIKDLRDMNYNIHTEIMANRRARYVLLGVNQ